MKIENDILKGSRLEMISNLAMEQYKKRTSHSKTFNKHLHFWFIEGEDERNDVYTDIDENGDFEMLLGIGLVEDIYAYAYSALANREVFTYLGDASNESNTTIKACYKDGDIILSSKPADKIRQDAAEKVAWYMILFVLIHELTHIINAHNTYLLDTYGNSRTKLKEHFKSLSSAYSADRKVLEYDADMGSATRMYNYMMDEVRLFDPLRTELEIEDVVFDLGGFAIYGVFALLSRSTSEENDLYMSLEQRALMVMGNIRDLILETKAYYRVHYGIGRRAQGYKYSLLSQGMISGFDSAAEFSKKILNKNFKSYKELMQSNSDMNERLDAVNAEWKRMLKYSDFREAAAGNLFDPEEEAKWRNEVGLPENVNDIFKNDNNIKFEDYIKRFYPEFTKVGQRLRVGRFDTGFSEDSRYFKVRELALEIYEDRTEFNPEIDSGLHFLFSEREDEINDIFTDIDESGEHVMVMGVNIFNEICSYADNVLSGNTDVEHSDEKHDNSHDLLVNCMFKAVLEHEITHLVNGHNEYMKFNYGQSKMKMLDDDVPIPEAYVKDRMILDFDADQETARYIYNFLVKECKLLDKEPLEKTVRDFMSISFGIAIFSMFAILRMQKVYTVTDYLPIELRFMLTYIYLSERMGELTTRIPDLYFNENIISGYDIAAEIFNKKVNPGFKSFEETEKEIFNGGIVYANRIEEVLEKWNKLIEDDPIISKAVWLGQDPVKIKSDAER